MWPKKTILYFYSYYLVTDDVFTYFTVLLALHAWFRRQHKLFIWCSAAAIIIFRAELAMFLGLLLFFELFYGRITVKRLVSDEENSIFGPHFEWP